MADLSEAKLIEKLRAIEALHARPGNTAERQAAANARERILRRLAELSTEDMPVEYRFSMPDMWSRRVFVALLRRYGIQPYRYRRQRYTTVMAKVSPSFVDETLWPQYEAFNGQLREYLGKVTDRVVSQVIHDDLTEAVVVEEAPRLSFATAEVKGATAAKSATEPADKTTKREEEGSNNPAPSEKHELKRERNMRKRKRKKRRR